MRYLGISDADMEKGHLRCDANVSLSDQVTTEGEIKKFYPKTEIKNLNSFKAVERALAYEIQRQTKIWQENEVPVQETRGWDENKDITEGQRTKEEAHDYRYLPEPDLPPINLSQAKSGIDVEAIKKSLVELPQARRQRFIEEYDLTAQNARVLVDDKGLAEFFEQTISELRAWLLALGEAEGTQEEVWQKHRGQLAKLTSNWLLNKLLAVAAKNNQPVYGGKLITPENFAEFITLIHNRKINSTVAQKVLEIMFQTGKDPSVIIEEQDLSGGRAGTDLETIIDQVIKENASPVEQYQKGKTTVIQYLIGQVMKMTKGQSDPKTIKEILTNKLK